MDAERRRHRRSQPFHSPNFWAIRARCWWDGRSGTSASSGTGPGWRRSSRRSGRTASSGATGCRSGSGKPGATIAAIDNTLGQPPHSTLTFVPGVSTSSIDIATGQYRMIVAVGPEFTLKVTTPVVHSGVEEARAVHRQREVLQDGGFPHARLGAELPLGIEYGEYGRGADRRVGSNSCRTLGESFPSRRSGERPSHSPAAAR